MTDHLEDVAQRVTYVVPENATTPAGEPLRDVVQTLAYLHDFGKATTYFQQYIGELPGEPEYDLYRHHAPIGSFAAYYALDARGFTTETCLAGLVAVAKHHGQLPDVANYIYQRSHRREGVPPPKQNDAERRQNAVSQQIKDIHGHVPELAAEVFDAATAGHGAWPAFGRGFTDLLNDITQTVTSTGTGPGINRDALSDSCYALVLQCWSALILTDKTSAAGAPQTPETYAAEPPSLDTLDGYVRQLEASVTADPNGTRSERLNHYRSRARDAVLKQTASFATNPSNIATLTLPTGMGKTLTGFSAAFDLRERLDGDRVIYALPFTSIIDQVVDEVEDIYDTDTSGRLLTAHHHLAETTITHQSPSEESNADEADLTDDVSGMLAESWRAGLTVTTFVQLFESLAGPQNRQSMKLPALQDSVVVLDEPQSLPIAWWKLAPRLITLLTEEYDATVIAMTATQPQLFEDAVELVDDPEVYFEAVERVTYELDSSTERYVAGGSGTAEPKTTATAAADLRDAVTAGASTLAICNTIDSARTLTKAVTEELPDATNVGREYTALLREGGTVDALDIETLADRVEAAGEHAVLHLSTRLRPADRLRLVEVAKMLTNRGHSLLAVTTQLVEAGVDISFDRVYRDLAPIDSVVQAAGRCNRSFQQEQGQVTVWWLEAPGGQEKTPAEAVYNRDTSLLPVTATALETVRERVGELTETAVSRDVVTEYYRRLHDDRNVGEQSYADFVDAARGDKLSELSLIKQRQAADIFVCRTDAERKRAESLRSAAERYEFDEVNRLLDKTKPLRVSVPIYPGDEETKDAITNLPPLLEDEGVYELDVQQYRGYFDQTTGFVVPESTVEHQFL